MILKDLLQDWTDFDIAEYYLACSLGIVKFDDNFDEFRKTKGIYNTKNPLGDSLYEMLEILVKLEILERDENIGYRWNEDFKV